MKRIHLIISAILASALFAASAPAVAQDYPNRAVRWIVPWPAGGAADVLARTVGQALAEHWGQPVVIENKPGGHTLIGAAEVIRAQPDGYTLFQPFDSTLTMNPFMFSRLPYDAEKSFTHITQLASVNFAVFVNDSIPVKTVPELVARAKAKPGEITFGAGAISAQLGGELLAREAGIKLQHVPYKGNADVIKAMLGGEINISVDALAPYLPYLKTGKLRILASTGRQRSAAMPEVPTLGELDYPNAIVAPWHALSAPAGLPSAIRDKIRSDVAAVLQRADVKEKLAGLGIEPVGSTPQEYLALIRSDSARIQPLIRELGLKLD